MRRKPLPMGAWLDWDPQWMAPEPATALLDELETGVPWEQLPIVVHGREVMQQRLMAWFGDIPYRYSGITLDPRPMPESLARVNEALSAQTGVALNHVVLNLYRDGGDNIAFHADDEPQLGHEPVVASLSLGATRKMLYKPKHKPTKRGISLRHGSLLVMGGRFQHKYYHAVPKQPEVDGTRINLTFRRLVGPPRTAESAGGTR